MSKITFKKPGNFIYPVPAVMVSLKDKSGRTNIITIAWTGTICSDPPMAYISVRKNRGSHPMLSESGEFVINLPDEKLVKALDYCGVRSIATVDKWKEMGLHEEDSAIVSAPSIKEAPVSIECKVTQVLPLGSHDMFLAEVVAVRVDEQFIDEKGAFHMDRVGLVAYSHGDYMSLGEKLGSFGYSVRKKPLPVKKTFGKKRPSAKGKTTEKVSEKKRSAKPFPRTKNKETNKKR
ncbi:MAG: flavin reductase family protein [Oribacterium sp.]|nr:flavin reductase family protein [Oribacterium sp.]